MELLNKAGRDLLDEMHERYSADNPNYFDAQAIAVVQMNDGKYAIIKSSNVSRAISTINTGEFNDLYPTKSINRIVGIKDCTTERTLEAVTEKFKSKYGDERVYSVAV